MQSDLRTTGRTIRSLRTAVLLSPDERLDTRHDLTGPEPLTLAEVATTITAAPVRQVTYYPETLDEAYASRALYGAPGWQVDAWVSTYTAIAAGELAGVSTAVADIAGHPATSFEALPCHER